MSISDSEQYNLLDQLAEDFAERFRRGERPALTEYTDRYPELADDIREIFPAMVKVELAEGVRQGGEEKEAGDSRGASPPPHQVGDYRILREIGRGGMGVVYEAEQISLGRRVALKVLPRHGSSDRMIRERFRREARAAARLHHTNIVPVYEVGQDRDVRFYAMQLIQGQGLDLVINELRRLRDRSGPGPKIRAASPGQSLRPRGEPAGQCIASSTLGEGVEVSPVLRSILTGRFDPGGQCQERVEASESMLARAVSGRLTTVAGTGMERGAAGSEPALARTDIESATSGDTIHPERLHSSAPDSSSSSFLSSSSAILPGGTQLSSVESGRHAFFRSLAHIGKQVAGGLAYAHARGIVHRDIKPSNLLLDTEGVVWITDFGLAKGDDEGLTHSGDILGTLRYMAPERFRGEGDARADVYALGLTLYELLTLRSGFSSSDRLELIEQIKTEEPQRPRAVDARIPRDLETIVLKAIDKDPKARYQSAEAMGEDLGRFVADEPIQARPVSAWERMWIWAKRRPAVAALLAVSSLAVLSLLIGAWWHVFELRIAKELADNRRHLAEDRQREAQRHLRNTDTGAEIARLREPGAGISALHFTPDGSKLVTGDHRGIIHVWETTPIGPWTCNRTVTMDPSPGPVASLALAPDGKVLAACSPNDPTILVLNFVDGTREAPLRGVRGERFQCLAFSPQANLLAAGFIHEGRNGILVWDVATRQLKPVVLPSLDRVSDVVFSPDGRYLAATCGDGGIALFDTSTFQRHLFVAGYNPIGVAFSPDSQLLAIPSIQFGVVRLWSVTANRELAVLNHPGDPRWVAFRADGQALVTADPRFVRIWNLAGTGEKRVLPGHEGGTPGMTFSPDGKLLVSVGKDMKATIWDPATGQVTSVAFLPDGRQMTIIGPMRLPEVWDVTTGHKVFSFPGENSGGRRYSTIASAIALSADGTWLAQQGTAVKVWDLENKKLLLVLPEERSTPWCLAWSPNKECLAVGSEHGGITIWNLPKMRAQLATIGLDW